MEPPKFFKFGLHQKGVVDKLIMEQMRKMWKEGEMCDFSITSSDGKKFPVHRTHVAAFSDYMRAMLTGNKLKWISRAVYRIAPS